jgi:hypothetical protein
MNSSASSINLLNEMRRRKQKYGVVTLCVGTGQQTVSVFDLLNPSTNLECNNCQS